MPTTLIQPSFAGGELAPSLHARVDIAKYATGAKCLKNFIVHAHGGASNRPGLEYLGDAKGEARLIPFQFSTVQAYALEFGDRYIRIWMNGGQVVYPPAHPDAGDIVEIVTPYLLADIPRIKFTQSADVLTLVHPNYEPRELTRTDHHLWTLSVITFLPAIAAPAAPAVATTHAAGGVAADNRNYSYKLCSVSISGGESSLAGPASSVNSIKMGLAIGGAPPYVYSKITLTLPAFPAGVGSYNIFRADEGSAAYGFVGSASSTAWVDENTKPDLTDTPPGGNPPFIGAGNYPGATCYYEQRRGFAATSSHPQTLWFTQSGNYQNLTSSSPVKDDDSIEFTLAAQQVNEIRHFVSLGDLIVLTSGGEWKVSGGGSGDVLSPSAIRVKPQGYRGASHVPPLTIGNTVLFVQEKGSIVRDLGYSLDADGYTGNDLSVLSNHLFRKRHIKEWAYAQAPYSLIWAVMSDGGLISMTYMREQEVWAWTRHETSGTVESVCSIGETGEDGVYFIVARSVGGTTKRFVERLHTREFDTIADAFFVDAGLTYSGTPATVISGLGHLEGRAVVALIDGSVAGDAEELIVTGGSVTLPYEGSTVHIGLAYTADLQTLDVELGQPTAQGLRKRVARAAVRVEETRGLKMGPTFDRLTEHKPRSTEMYGDPASLITGDIDLIIEPQWSTSGSVCIRQSYPLPATILAVMPEIEVGGR
jgi:hypothetical protein